MLTRSMPPADHLRIHTDRMDNPSEHSHKIAARIALVLVVAAFASTAFLLLPKSEGLTATAPENFVEQMVRASLGTVFEKNIYGGPIRIERKGGQITVIAEEIPPGVCVSVGWKLVRKGLLNINGVTPVRVSAAKLSELCNQDESNATLAWSPKAVE